MIDHTDTHACTKYVRVLIQNAIYGKVSFCCCWFDRCTCGYFPGIVVPTGYIRVEKSLVNASLADGSIANPLDSLTAPRPSYTSSYLRDLNCSCKKLELISIQLRKKRNLADERYPTGVVYRSTLSSLTAMAGARHQHRWTGWTEPYCLDVCRG